MTEAVLPQIRRAVAADAPSIVPMAIELYQLESLEFDPARAAVALDTLLASPDVGFVLTAPDPAGGLAAYGIVTFGFDLEFGGRDAFLTELLVAESWRGRGLGQAMLEAIEREACACQVHALHLLVRPDNPAALNVYKARGFTAKAHLVLSKRLDRD